MPKVGQQRRLETGVYCYYNTLNGKRYVGSTAISFKSRWGTHLYELRKGCHGNRHLQAAYNKYGEQVFKWIVLEQCLPNDCIDTEQKWLDCYQAANQEFGYNLSPTAGSVLGFKKSAEESEKSASWHRGKKRSAETKSNISASLTGKSRPAWHMEGARQALLGKKLLEEHKDKISAGLLEHYSTHAGPNLGRELPEEWRENIAKAHRGKKAGPCPEERKRKIAETLRGRKLSEETRRRMSEAHKRRHKGEIKDGSST